MSESARAERHCREEYHLHKVFTKLAISSRTQLDGALPGKAPEPQPA